MTKILKESFCFIKKYYFILFCALALILPDAVLNTLIDPGVFTQGYVKFASTLFTWGWVLLIIFFCVFILPKRAGKIVFFVLSVLYMFLAFCEYVYYKIFDQFFWLQSIVLAGEGADYISSAAKLIDARLIIYTSIALVSLIVSLIFWKTPQTKTKKRFWVLVAPLLLLVITHVCMQPELHNDSMDGWDTWRKPRVVYKNFNDINKSLETCGLYQFTFRNLYTCVFPNDDYDEEVFVKVNEYFALKGEPEKNKYSGIFKGKNVIAVMMESIDTWMIDAKHTPTLNKMMKNGINFTNYNAPFFGAGFTFSSEFAFNTGFFTPVSAVSASNFSQNTFPYSIANLFKEAGYTTNSFHFNDSEFYNRGIMHKSFGYERYNSVSDFGITGVQAELDSNMLKNDEIYNKMTEKTPFYNFVITYSAHLPYKGESAKLDLAKEYYPDYLNDEIEEEKNNIQILAKDTDEFFRLLLERLEADGLLDDTVIICYTDHFAYGVSDKALLEEWKGDTLSYTVPAFIYCKGLRASKVSKPMMTIDWAPTIVNLFGLKNEGRYIGSDILNPKNDGFVYFETGAWMDGKYHYVPSEDEKEPDELIYIEKQNQKVKEMSQINDAVVLGDYYKKR